MNEKEYEKKIMLSEDEYMSLVRTFSSLDGLTDIKSSKVTQINHYYDSSSFSLNSKSETLRVRQIGDCLKLQRKTNKVLVDGVRYSDESELTLNTLPSQISLEQNTYNYLGSSVTNRTNFYYETMVLSFDENIYLGIVDFELELEAETMDDVNKYFLQFFQEFEGASNKSPGKYSRFVQRLKGMDFKYEL